MNLPNVTIYSDWWANPNPGPWWYWIIMRYKSIEKEFKQWYVKTTNNRMELSGAITWLSKLKTKSKVDIYTDSQYTINWIQKWWAEKWKQNNWYRTKSQKAQNYDLWEQLLDLTKKHEVKFHWVKWHAWHIENERCDQLATEALESENLIVDIWYKEEVSENKDIKNKAKSKQPVKWEKIWDLCKKCDNQLEKRIPKHNKKTLQKKFFYEYYHHCPACKTNYFLEDAKRDIKEFKLK